MPNITKWIKNYLNENIADISFILFYSKEKIVRICFVNSIPLCRLSRNLITRHSFRFIYLLWWIQCAPTIWTKFIRIEGFNFQHESIFLLSQFPQSIIKISSKVTRGRIFNKSGYKLLHGSIMRFLKFCQVPSLERVRTQPSMTKNTDSEMTQN